MCTVCDFFSNGSCAPFVAMWCIRRDVRRYMDGGHDTNDIRAGIRTDAVPYKRTLTSLHTHGTLIKPLSNRKRKSPNHTHNLTFSLRISNSWTTGIQTAAVPYEIIPASLHRPIHAMWAKTYGYIYRTICMALRTVRSKKTYNPNRSRIGRMAVRSIRIHYVSCEPHYTFTIQYHPHKTYC